VITGQSVFLREGELGCNPDISQLSGSEPAGFGNPAGASERQEHLNGRSI